MKIKAGGSTCGKCGIKKLSRYFGHPPLRDIIIKTLLDAVEL